MSALNVEREEAVSDEERLEDEEDEDEVDEDGCAPDLPYVLLGKNLYHRDIIARVDFSEKRVRFYTSNPCAVGWSDWKPLRNNDNTSIVGSYLTVRQGDDGFEDAIRLVDIVMDQ